jgi:SSS family solute:Na+ symporter
LAGFADGYPHGSFLWIVNHIYFQYYSVLICLVCMGVMVGVSYATRPPSLEQIQGLTFGTVTREQRQQSRSSWSWGDVATSGLVLAAIAAAYLYFTG